MFILGYIYNNCERIKTMLEIENIANNQTFVTMPNGDRYFKSYNSWVARWIAEVDLVELDSHTWDYSRTTSKYLAKFLGVPCSKIRQKANANEYKLVNIKDAIRKIEIKDKWYN